MLTLVAMNEVPKFHKKSYDKIIIEHLPFYPNIEAEDKLTAEDGEAGAGRIRFETRC